MEDELKIGCAVRAISYFLVLGIAFLVTRGCNNFFNNKQINKNSYRSDSYSTGITGHVEYTRYNDGSKDIKVYPGFVGIGHRIFDSELYHDLNGNGKIDRIRRNGAEWKMNSLTEILVREYDYNDNKERFDEADKMLRELIEKYHE